MFAPSFSTVLSTVALLIALVGVGIASAKKPNQARPNRKLRLQLETLEDEVEALKQRIKSQNAKLALYAARATRKNVDVPDDEDSSSLRQLPGETGEEWKARIRKLRASGKIHLVHK